MEVYTAIRIRTACWIQSVERVKRIELSYKRWQRFALPLSYTRKPGPRSARARRSIEQYNMSASCIAFCKDHPMHW
jgi:hypothetical protein